MRASEFQASKLVIFDIDDTLVHTQTKVHVVKDGRVTHSLNSHEFTHYKLQPGEQFDFGDFANAREFFENAKPIIPMLNQLKQDIATGNKVVMVTARADFNDRELFLDTFRKYGVDMSKVHVYRAGNMKDKIQTEEKKKIIIRNLLSQHHYTKAIMYDDAIPNLHSFVELKKEYPHTKFYAWHVSLEGKASEYHRTNETKNYHFAGARVGQKAGIPGQLRGKDKGRKDGKQPAFNKLVGGGI
jgi:FMN phosphatase YigB (HAD superfamily)